MGTVAWLPSIYFRRIWAVREPRLAALALLSPAFGLGVCIARTNPALLTTAALLLDYMLLFWGIFLAVAIISVVVAPWPLARALAVMAAGTSTVVAAVALLAAFSADPVRWWGVGLVALALVASGVFLLFSTRQIVANYVIQRPRLAAVAAGLLALLPLVQFWNATSFVPAHQQTTLGAAVKADGVATGTGTNGEITVTLTNSGDVGALVLSSELITCERSAPQSPREPAVLYKDKRCVVDQLVGHLDELDARSTVALTSALRQPQRPPDHVRLLEATVLVWYARQDRLQVGDLTATTQTSPEAAHECATEYEGGNHVEVYEVQPNSRVEALVERPRRLVYVWRGRAGDAYAALQPTNHQMCNKRGLPEDDEKIDEDVGLSFLRLNYETWLAAR